MPVILTLGLPLHLFDISMLIDLIFSFVQKVQVISLFLMNTERRLPIASCKVVVVGY